LEFPCTEGKRYKHTKYHVIVGQILLTQFFGFAILRECWPLLLVVRVV
jgi:hypothetical protein